MSKHGDVTALAMLACLLVSPPGSSPASEPAAGAVALAGDPAPAPVGPAAAASASNAPATVYVYVGRTLWPGGAQPGIGKERWDIAVDGGSRVHLADNRFLEIDTAPGTHRFTRYQRGLLKVAPASIDLTLAAGEEAYLGLNLYQEISPATERAGNDIAFAGGLLFGMVGGAVTGLAVAAAVAPSHPAPLDHPWGVWLVREPPPAGDSGAGAKAK